MSQLLRLNGNIGQGFGRWDSELDKSIIPFLHMANIACGFHASEPHQMAKSIQLAHKHSVTIGAHVSYPDLVGYGMRSISHQAHELSHIVSYQIGALQSLAQLYDSHVEYIKPHGALYHDMMASAELFEAIMQAVMPTGLPLMVLAQKDNEVQLELADEYNVPLLFEVFADRVYRSDGTLLPHHHPQAFHHNNDDIFYQAMQLANFGTVTTHKGHSLALQADTISLSVDQVSAINVARKIAQTLDN